MSKRIAFTVSGTVQGVNFRYFTKKKAQSHEVVGWVRNTEDGKVEGEAQGSTPQVDKLVADIKQGPRHAHVTNYEEKALDLKGDGEREKGFDVVR